MGNTNEKKKKDTPQEVVNVTPTGLYQRCTWDQRTMRRLILEKKLAPIVPGQPDKTALELEECPICFLYYPTGLNRAVCCKQGLCTECFTQIKSTPQQILDCPFCNQPNFVVVYLGPPNREEKEKEALEEQRVVEIQRKRKEEEARDQTKQRSASLPSTSGDRMKTFDEVAQDISSGKVVYTPPTSSSLPPPPPIFTNQRAQRNGAKSVNSRGTRSTTWAGRNRVPHDLDGLWENDQDVEMLEELMLMEAIRLSLSESGGGGAEPSAPANPSDQKESNGSTSNTSSTTTTTTTTKTSQTKNEQESSANTRNSLGELFFFEEEQRPNLFEDENEDLWGEKGEKQGQKGEKQGEKSEKWSLFDDHGEKQKDNLFGDDEEQDFFKFIPTKTSTSMTTTSKTQSSPSLTTSTTSTFSQFTTTTTSSTGTVRSMSLSPSSSSSTSSSAPSSSPASPSTSPPMVSSLKQGMTNKKEFTKSENVNTNNSSTTNTGAVAVAVDLDDGAVCQEAN